MKKIGIIIIVVATIFGFWMTQKYSPKMISSKDESTAELSEQTYWTCPMHPQIHQDHAGECPICHMKLVQVKVDPQDSDPTASEKKGSVQINSEQMTLLGVQRAEVEKMTLKMKIPISGRFISSTSVAFQIYESDLKYVKRGLVFKGVSHFSPDNEISGIITVVDSIVDPTSRTIRVVGSIKNGFSKIPSETSFRGDIIVELKDRISIPESSVLHTGAGDFVYIFVKDNELIPRKVSLGIKTEGFYDVLAGVQPGEIMSSGPNFLIDSESKIRAISMPTTDEMGGPEKSSVPSCPKGQHWDIPMSMCMPGKG
ncbi:MAG: hypothetical protein A2622_09620 [Bdellovibrionales bacterium RIFCSPHIGHO2_01_FULL_40_29]|nr:MAG: hypothetical protein A2622_09620 [Bdellovibrionales bacterium RIFCSPHIGHO2_01_FULL_40_29]OFZ32490.1 MAG: hypothetical protein A3D17_13045 [Bdellovibrionales bacterium RIFCSPHIGHO2_02_FULL_40_15]